MPSWELLAVLLGIIYLLAAVREYLWCWYAAFASTLIYLFLFWDVRLLMESGLQLYYLVMAVYGWWSWRHAQQRGWRPVDKPLALAIPPGRNRCGAGAEPVFWQRA